MNLLSRLLWFPLTLAGCRNMPAPSDLQGKPISQLVIHDSGGKAVDDARLRTLIRSQPGTSYSREKTDNDIAVLYESGLVNDIRFVPQASGSGVRLIAEVETRPSMGPAGFIGNTAFSDQRLAKESKIKKTPLSQEAIQEACVRIEKLYHSHGYPKATVRSLSRWDQEAKRNDLHFVIDEGPAG